MKSIVFLNSCLAIILERTQRCCVMPSVQGCLLSVRVEAFKEQVLCFLSPPPQRLRQDA